MKKIIVLFAILLYVGMAQIYAQPVLYGLTSTGGETIGTISKFETVSNNLVSIYNFPSGPRNPFNNDLTQAANSKLYGMTLYGGSKTNNQVGGYGTIFSFDPVANTQTKLYDFDSTNGRNPNGSLVQAIDGKLYGMTTLGGSTDNGTIFSFDPVTNTYTKLLDFNITNGSTPFGSLIQANDGKLYGMTKEGGSNGLGTIFSFDLLTNTHTILHDFNTPNGYFPNGSLMQASDGNLYGMTQSGGSSGGTIFSFDPMTNTHTLLHDFDYFIGNKPYGNLVQAGNGKLYGMTYESGSQSGNGTIFSFDPVTNTHANLHDFDVANGTDPYGSLVLANDGKLYGMTSAGGSIGPGYGTIFSFDPMTNSHTKLHDFNIINGQYANGSMVLGSDGKLYGMTYVGGISGNGTIFSFDPLTATHEKRHDFTITNGSNPLGSLMLANDRKFYGMTSKGGNYEVGTIFSFDPGNNTIVKLHDFNNTLGGSPKGSLLQALDGKLYGMTSQIYVGFQGNNSNGTIFSFDLVTNTHTTLYDFDNTHGRYPNGSLIQANNGKLYGLTNQGGSSNYGTLFSFDPVTNTHTSLHNFNVTNGGNPNGSLIQASDGKLYGTTNLGSIGFKGSSGFGTIFSFDPVTNTHAKLHDFNLTNGSRPNGSLVQVSDGKLYGLTNQGGSGNFGTIFSFDPVTNTHTKLHDFDFTNGSDPFGSLVLASDGKLYGMTQHGGGSGFGTIFSFDPVTNTYTKLQDFNYLNGSNPTYGALIEIISSVTPNNSFFRSRQSGNWSDPNTWEYSADSLAWLPAVRIPLPTDSTILIRTGHSVDFALESASVDNLVVQEGGILTIKPGVQLRLLGTVTNRPAIEVNGQMVVESGEPRISIYGDIGANMLVNGKVTMYGGGIQLRVGYDPLSLYFGIIISQKGTLELKSPSDKFLEGVNNFGTVNWKAGNIIMPGFFRVINNGVWNDSSNSFFSSKTFIVFRNLGTYRKVQGSSALGGNPASRIYNLGKITGVGRIDLRRGDSSLNLGIINPGDSIGKLSLAFSQPNTLTELNIQLANLTGPGNGHDLLELEGNLTLGGTLNVSELVPLANANFTIIRKISGTLSGTFVNTNLPANYTLEYYSDSVVLVKGPPVVPRNVTITNPAAITEGNSGSKELKFVVRLSAASTGTVRVNYTTADSTATAGEDYTAISGTIAIPAGTLTDTIRVPILGDKLVEPVERIKVLLSNPVNGIITTALGVGTINNDDALPALSITNYTLSEGTTRDSLLQVQVRLSASYPLPVMVNYATQDSTATDGVDYTGASGTLTFQPGDTLEFIPVLIKADGIDEGNEIININLSAASNATLAATTRGRITINDDDNIPVITLGNVSITEGNTTDTLLQVKVRLSRSYVLPVTVNYSTSDSTATQGIDYVGGSSTLTFLPGDTLEYIPVLIKGDRIDELNEIIKITYSSPVNGTLSTTVSRVTITDNDLLPAVTFTNLTLTEGNNDQFNTATVTVRLNRSYPLPVTVNYILLDSTAVNGSDYQSVQGTLNFAAEDTLESIIFPILGDRVVEPNEIIKLVFSSPVNATATSVPYRITIGNDDSYPTVSVTAPAVTEGDAGTVNQVLTVRLSKRYPQPVSVLLSTANITALSGTDYARVDTTLIFPADGDTLQTVTISVLGDLLDEANETYRVQLTTPVNATLSGTGIITATINDNDAVPAIRIYDSSATENSGSITLRVAMNTVSGRQVKVAYRTVAGTAVQTLDYQPVVTDTLVFNAGETVKYIIIPVLTDALSEVNENFTVVLSGPVNSTVTTSQGGDNTGVATIINSVSAGLNLQAVDRNLATVSETLQVKVLPNPSRNYFQLNITGNTQGTIRLRITDFMGRVMEDKKLEGTTPQIKVGENWINGTYILEVIQGEERKTIQLVKLR